MSHLDWKLLDHAAAQPVEVGDIVSTEAGGMPIYRVLALAGDAAWLDDERHAPARLIPLDRFRWRAAA